MYFNFVRVVLRASRLARFDDTRRRLTTTFSCSWSVNQSVNRARVRSVGATTSEVGNNFCFLLFQYPELLCDYYYSLNRSKRRSVELSGGCPAARGFASGDESVRDVAPKGGFVFVGIRDDASLSNEFETAVSSVRDGCKLDDARRR